MKRALAILMSTVVAGAMSASAQMVAGWDTFSGGGGAGAVSAPVTATDVSASFVSTTEELAWHVNDGRGASADGDWGTFAGPPAASTVAGDGVTGENLELPNATTGGTLTFSITNNGVADIELGGFHFDSYAFRPKAARAYELSVLPGGGISDGVIYTSADDEITSVSGAWNNLAHDDIDHDLTGLADHILGAGESVDFLLAFSSGVGDGAGGHDLWVDNVAISEVIVTAPIIVEQPQDAEVVLGAAEAGFSALVTGTAPLAYQWFFGAGELTGETNSTLTILNPGAAELGGYSVTVSNSLGSISSDSATLSYVAGPITPGDGAAVEGGIVTYGVDLPQATTNYTYQWKFNGTPLGGETGAELVLNPVELADAGNYTVDVTYDGITEPSDPAILLVAASAANDYPTTVLADNPVAWWRLGELSGADALDSAGSAGGPYDGIYLPLVQLDQSGAILGDTDRSARFTDTADSKVTVAFDGDLNPAGAFTVEAWALVEGGNGTKRAVYTSMEDVSGNEKYGYEIAATAGNRWRFSTGRFAPGETIIEGPEVVLLQWTHLVAVYDGTSSELYVNGYPAGAVTVSSFEPVDPGFPVPLFIGASGGEDPTGEGDSFFDGLIDDVAFYNSALSGADVLEHYAAGLPSDAPPQFSLEPGDELRDISGQVTFTVAVRSVGEPTYQWQKDGVDIPGATMTSLTLTNLMLSDEGGYQALADVAGNVVTSSVGNLTIRPPSTVLLENFEAYSTGVFGDVASSNWVLDAATQTNWWTVEDEGGNQYLRLLGKDEEVTTTIGSLNMGDSNQVATATNGVPTEGISTVFLRFYYESGVDNGLWWGTSDGAGGGFGGLRGNTTSRQNPAGLSVRTGGSTVVLTTSLSTDVWYNMWQVQDNDADTVQVYLTTGNQHATLADRFEVNGVFAFPFRTDSASDVSVDPLNYYRFIARPRAAGHRVDDIYISTGINLDNPLSLGPLSISLQGGSPEVTWTDAGTLQRVEDPAGGTWTDLPAATSPYTPPAGPGAEHFRLRE